MVELVEFHFVKHIEFIHDCLDEASPYSWPDVVRQKKPGRSIMSYLKI